MLHYILTVFSKKDLQQELKAIACDPRGIEIMCQKRSSLTIKLCQLPGFLGLVLKEEALSLGADCALPSWTIQTPQKNCSAILLINPKQLLLLIQKLKKQAFQALHQLSSELKQYLKDPTWQPPKFMGIVNVTPDSFSDGGKFYSPDTAVQQALQLVKEGATLIDIGGESTRPGATEISTAEELRRTIPAIRKLHALKPKLLISIDTTKSTVARVAVKAGAKIINDISGLQRDPAIAQVAAKSKAKLILMHRLAPSKTMQKNPKYQDILTEIISTLKESIELALRKGVKKSQIIIDPGIGFGKTTEHNLYLIKNLAAFRSLGCPLMLGASRKSVIGNTLGLSPQERLYGTIATSLFAQLGQADYLRVHDVRANREAVKMFSALLKG